jgi:hypothetical protein
MTNRLHNHRQPNHDLYLECHDAAQHLNKKVEWVKEHQDEGKEWTDITDLKAFKLNPAATLNIWCNSQAEQAKKKDYCHTDANVLPAKNWAVFSCYVVTQKLTGQLNKGIHDARYTESLVDYIHKKNTI